MSVSDQQGFDGLRGSVLFCHECARPTVHFSAHAGLPVCGFCGATPPRLDADDDARVVPVPVDASLLKR